MSFVHLHLHTQYSLLDGANRLDDVVEAAAAAGMPAIAITDHGNVFGIVEFHNRARRAGIKPILGMEAYVAQGSRVVRDPRQASSNHLVLLARNETGYRNLIRLTSRAYLEGFYYKPRIDKDLLREMSDGLIGLSACLKGEIDELIVARRESEAEAAAIEFREIFGDGNFFLELQDHGIAEQRLANEALRRISRRTGIPLVATNDTHYLRQTDHFAHDVLLCIGTQKVLSDQDRLRYASDQFYLKNADEMRTLFPQDPQALENSLLIAERCNVEIPSGEFLLPDFPVPAGYSLQSYFEMVAKEGLEERLEALRRRQAPSLRRLSEEVYWERLRREIEIIEAMRFPGYFLVVWDFIRYARQHDIPVGPGRGSAAGSLVAFALRITDIDPLEYSLLFERFLNPDRISMPDIDIDFCMRRRGDVIQYVSEKYGRDHVAQIITFGTLAAKAVVRDVGRVMGVPYAKADRIAKLIPDMTRSLAEAVKEIPALAAEVANDPEIRDVVEVGSRLEGLTRHASVHAAGVVITPRPAEELVPLYKTSKDEVVTQWDKDVIEGLGLLKMDFLGLRTLTVIDDTLKTLRHQGVELDLDEVPLDDGETFRLFCEGRSSGIFQFESSGMKSLLRQAAPERFEDLAALNALYRPGALSVGMVERFVQRKQGKEKVVYPLPETEPILRETYGVIAYQEQVMLIAVEVAGFSMAEADTLRKAMGKKKPEVMAKLEEKFVEGAAARGVSEGKARGLWEHIAPFAGYGFNKSHSVAYAMLAYKTAFLKAHHPVAFMAAMLSSEMGSKDNVAKYIHECREMGIEVLPPSVNDSDWPFTVSDGAVRFGLGAVKGVGEGAAEAILAARRRVGRFRGLAHFAQEVDLKALNHKVFEVLVKSGAFDEMGISRKGLSENLDRILGQAQRRQRDHASGQAALFGGPAGDPEGLRALPEWRERRRLRFEREALGFYLTGNPLSDHKPELERLTTHTCESLREASAGDSVCLGGVVSRMQSAKIKSGPNAGRYMGRFVLEDLTGSIPVAVFADQFQRCGPMLADEAVILVKGSLRDRGAELELMVEEIRLLEEAARELVTALRLQLPSRLGAGEMLRLRDLLIEHSGDVPVRFELRTNAAIVHVAAPDQYRVRLDPALMTGLEMALGPGAVFEEHAAEDL